MVIIKSNYLWILLALMLVLSCSPTSGKGGGRGGGGGRFGGARSSISRSSTASRTGTRFTGGRTSTGWRSGFGVNYRTALTLGMIYGVTRYQRRRYYYDDRNSEPTICYNKYDHQFNSTTNFEYFICPLNEQPDDHTYCCGEEEKQYCCNFWGDGGRVAGVVIGILAFIGITALMIWCFCRKTKKMEETFANSSLAMRSHNAPARQIHAGLPLNHSENFMPQTGRHATSVYPNRMYHLHTGHSPVTQPLLDNVESAKPTMPYLSQVTPYPVSPAPPPYSANDHGSGISYRDNPMELPYPVTTEGPPISTKTNDPSYPVFPNDAPPYPVAASGGLPYPISGPIEPSHIRLTQPPSAPQQYSSAINPPYPVYDPNHPLPEKH